MAVVILDRNYNFAAMNGCNRFPPECQARRSLKHRPVVAVVAAR